MFLRRTEAEGGGRRHDRSPSILQGTNSEVKEKKLEFSKIQIRLKHLILMRFAGIVDESFSLILIPDFDS